MRFSKKERKLYLDIMLDLNQMRASDKVSRKQFIAERILEEVPAALRKYKVSKFDDSRFIEDMKNWLSAFR